MARIVKPILLYRVGLLVAVAIAYFYIPGLQELFDTGMTYLRYRDFEGLRQFILSYGVWAPVISICIMLIQSLVPLVPGIFITLTNAWIFGWQYGALYSWIGALIGASLDFGIARWYGRLVVQRFVNAQYLMMADLFLNRYGLIAIMITRFTPIIPFKVISYGAGLTNISLCRFLIGTAIGQAPAILLYSIVGHHITHNIRIAMLMISLLLTISVVSYYYRVEIKRYFISGKE